MAGAQMVALARFARSSVTSVLFLKLDVSDIEDYACTPSVW
jgi:hypothetical protein